MGFIEALFQSTYDRLLREARPASTEMAIIFEPYRSRLGYLAASLGPLPVKLECSDGTAQHPWGFRIGQIFLPEMIDVFTSKNENYDVLKFRLIIELANLGLAISGADIPTSYSFGASNTVHNHLKVPLKELALLTFIDNVSVRLGHIAAEKNTKSTDAQALLLFHSPTQKDTLTFVQEIKEMKLMQSLPKEAQGITTRLRKKNVTETSEICLNDADMNPLVHTFEKIHTLDDYKGGNKQFDESDELNAHARAINDLELNTVIRTNKTSTGTIEGDISRDIEIASSNKKKNLPYLFRYDEWNEHKESYLSHWCHVKEHSWRQENDSSAQTALDLSDEFTLCRQKGRILHQRLAAFFNTRRWHPKQADGCELDLEAVIDNHVEWFRGGNPNDNNYQDLVRTELDFALTILCDSSLSTEAWIDGKQVQKIIRDAAITLSYALQGLGCNWSVAAFNSFTRDDCHYYLLKDFADDASMVKRNIGLLKPDGYTRIGPALRHAGNRLSQLRAKENMVIIITDAKPTDYDHYEGSYGIKDVKRAVGELMAKNIHTYAISISDKREDQAVRMFGHATARCVSSDHLSELIFNFFLKFISRL